MDNTDEVPKTFMFKPPTLRSHTETVARNKLELKPSSYSGDSTHIEDFVKIFTKQTFQIEEAITILNAEHADLMNNFIKINAEILDLQKFVSNATSYLPDYHIKSCQNLLKKLRNRFDEAKKVTIPKKKFSFITRKASNEVVKPNQVSEISHIKSDANYEWTLSNFKNRYVLLEESDVSGKDITIFNLKNCFIEIPAATGSIQMSELEDCTLLAGPTSRSVLIEKSKNCKIVVACQQLRLHTSINIDLGLHVTSRPVIEDCSQIIVHQYNYVYNNFSNDLLSAGLDLKKNNWKNVADFNWLSSDILSPNWHIQETTEEDWNWNAAAQNFKEICCNENFLDVLTNTSTN